MQKTEIPEGKYDAWLIWSPADNCNLNCKYCCGNLAGTNETNLMESAKHLLDSLKRKKKSFRGWLLCLAMLIRRPPKNYAIDIPALLNVLDRTNKVFRINFTGGGEPFLVSNIVKACEQLTQKHYISFNTNLIPKSIVEFSERIDPRRVVSIHASLHIQELERLNLFDVFARHFLLLKGKGFQITAKAVAHPELFPELERYRYLLKEKGVDFCFGRFTGIYRGKKYPTNYTPEEIEAFGLLDHPDLKTYQKGVLCNAGYNAAMVWETGDVVLCNDVIKPLGHIYKGFQFKDHLTKCPVAYCSCPLKFYDLELYRKALKENKTC